MDTDMVAMVTEVVMVTAGVTDMDMDMDMDTDMDTTGLVIMQVDYHHEWCNTVK